MKVNIESIDQVTKRLKVEVPPDVVAKEFESAYQDLSRKAKIKGFRPGKVPRPLLERYYGEAVKEEVISRVIEGSYREAIDRENVSPVSHPRIEGVKLDEGKGVQYSATVEVKPEVEVKEYTGLRVTRRRYSVTEEDVARMIDELRERYAVVEPTSLVRPLQKGDFAVVDYQRLSPQQVRPQVVGGRGARAADDILEKKENVSVEVGSGTSPFDGALLGMEAGQERDFVVTDSSLSTSGSRYRVKIKEVKVKVLPPLDDEFSRTVGYNSVQDLRAAVHQRLEADAVQRTDREFREHLTDALIERNPVEAPSSMVENQVEHLLAEMKRLLGAQADQIEEGKFREEIRPRAVKQVKIGLILDALAKKEGVTVTEEDVQAELEKIAALRKDRVEAVRERYRRQGLLDVLKAEIRETKAMNRAAEAAQVTEV